MELYQLKAFVAVAEHGKMTRAAESLHTSQPAVSAQIKSLEQSFGVQLFHRRAAGTTLTDPGKALLEQARITLAQARTTEDLARHLRGIPSRSLRIGINDAGNDEVIQQAPAIVGWMTASALQASGSPSGSSST